MLADRTRAGAAARVRVMTLPLLTRSLLVKVFASAPPILEKQLARVRPHLNRDLGCDLNQDLDGNTVAPKLVPPKLVPPKLAEAVAVIALSRRGLRVQLRVRLRARLRVRVGLELGLGEGEGDSYPINQSQNGMAASIFVNAKLSFPGEELRTMLVACATTSRHYLLLRIHNPPTHIPPLALLRAGTTPSPSFDPNPNPDATLTLTPA